MAKSKSTNIKRRHSSKASPAAWKTYAGGKLVRKPKRAPAIYSQQETGPLYAGRAEPPKLWAIVDVTSGEVLARCMQEGVAEGFAQGWSESHGVTRIVPEPIILVGDDQIYGQL